MKHIRLLTVACALAAAAPAFAGTITFEGAPTGVDLGNYYAGVTFAPTIQAEYQVLPFNPAHSGDEELAGVNISNPLITFSFATPQTQFSFWYTTQLGITVTAYNASANVVGSPIVEAANTGSDAFLSYITGSPDITTVVISDNALVGTFDTIDDLSAPGITGLPTPDAASTLGLFGLSGLALLAFRNKFVAR